MKIAITSMAEGEDWQKISAFTFPTFQSYANRIGADFVPLKGRRLPNNHFHWEKLACASLLEKYDRVMWTDADVIIKSTAPSIFEAVPQDCFGAFDEGIYQENCYQEISNGASYYGTTVKPNSERHPKYFNAGLMVFGKEHKGVFDVPSKFFHDSHVPEQTYVNVRFQQLGFKFYDLGKIWNGYWSWHPFPDQREKLHIIHYAGWGKVQGWQEAMLAEMRKDYR